MPDTCNYTHSNAIETVEMAPATKRFKYQINADDLNRIEAEKRRTGKGSRGLLHAMHHAYPPELSADMIDNWMSGRTKKAYWEHVHWVLERYAILPTKNTAAV
ncbi:MAG: hypothetical protein ABJO01_07035 [Parasphingorhabdus sp.]|uniref:hypothetical protein n=1 Tax=Parasphingorhabdus sp. TaxID=2709688 RepID=UPI003296C161